MDYVVKVTGNEPAEILRAFQDQGRYDPISQTIKFKSEDIKGEYDVSCKAGSTLPLDKLGRDRILSEVMTTGAQMASLPSIPPFMSEVIKERLRDYDIPSLEQAFEEQEQQADQAAEEQSHQGISKPKSESGNR